MSDAPESDPIEAAFERARRKLASVRDGAEEGRGPAWSVATGKRVAWPIVQICILVLLPLLVIWLMPESLPSDAWVENPVFPAALFFVAALLPVHVLLWRRARRMHSSEKALRDFYDSVFPEDAIKRIEAFVVAADFDGAPRRPPPFRLTRPLPPLHNGPELDAYWTALRKPTDKYFCQAEIKSIRWLEIEDDLRLAYLTVRLTKRDALWQSVWVVPLFVIALIAVDRVFAEYRMWVMIGLYALLWGAIAAVTRLFRRHVGTYRVRKLLVRSGKQWRLFCGDWEGWEERDLSWLDSPMPQTTKT